MKLIAKSATALPRPWVLPYLFRNGDEVFFYLAYMKLRRAVTAQSFPIEIFLMLIILSSGIFYAYNMGIM